MKNDELKKTHEDLDGVIKESAAALGVGYGPGDRDRAIVMACATIAKSELPNVAETTSDMLAVGKDRLRKDIERMLTSAREIVDDRLEVGRYRFTRWTEELYHLAHELAYEFDEKWAAEISNEREKVEAECEQREEISADEIWKPGEIEEGTTWNEFPEAVKAFLEPKLETTRRGEIKSWEIDVKGKITIHYRNNPAKGLMNREGTFFYTDKDKGIV